ncbi:MAG: signal peptidase I [Chitinophagaceae bacterium]|nr:signal peptidase I [Chitinophagaceae bacterium]
MSCKGRVYRAGSNSMAETISPGESFYVKKTSTFERNDIVMFSFYGNDYTSPPDEETHTFTQHWEDRIYRLIAYSGDTLQIINDEVFVNNKPVPFPPGAKLPYIVYTSQPLEKELPEEELYNGVETAGDTFIYRTTLTKTMAREMESKKPTVLKVKRQLDDQLPIMDSAFARPAAGLKWNTSNYGPLRIPLPGETILVNEANFKLYHNIPGIRLGQNTITEKLYFLMGDNRHRAEDSRFIGFISHSRMRGIVK